MEIAIRCATLLLLSIVLLPVGFVAGQESTPASRMASFGKLPLHFVENRGVYPEEVKYYIQGADKTLFFTSTGVTFRLHGQNRGWAVKLDFVGANEVQPLGLDKQPAVFSYFRGPEKDWKTGLPTFSKVVYRDLWPGIDLVYTGTVNQLKYEFVVAPGADPARIRLRYRGASSVAITERWALKVETPVGSFDDAPPHAWQEVGGLRLRVEMAYRLGEDNGFGFSVGEYNRTRPLVLDPAVLVYCGYIGGSGDDANPSFSGSAGDIAVDAAGHAYVTGQTQSPAPTFPATVGPDLSYNGTGDVFVAKVNANGTALMYCGYIGGGALDHGGGIAVDGAGNAYVTGWTSSDEKTFPVKVGPDLTYNGGSWGFDAFVAKVNAQGTGLVYCGYIGGASDDWGEDIAVDAAGNAYVTGLTDSDQRTFPVKVGPDLTYNGGSGIVGDAFVSKVNAQGTAFVYCGYIGGASDDWGYGIAVDAAGNAYVTGLTLSTQQTFPVKVGPDLTHNRDFDAFVAKVSAGGTSLAYCGYIGGASREWSHGIAVDAAGNAHITGFTHSDETTFPVRVGPDLTHHGGMDAFVAKVNATGASLIYCGYIGGASAECGYGIAVDHAGSAYLTGGTGSDEKTFPVTVGPDLSFNGRSAITIADAFVAKVSATGKAIVYCGYIGGASDECGYGVAVDTAGNAYVTGSTGSDERTFPVTVGPDLSYNGGTANWMGDGFVAKVALTQLRGSGTAQPGTGVSLTLTATADVGLPFRLGTSLGTGPISIDTRKLDLSADDLLTVSAGGWWPSVFVGYGGVIDSNGQATAAINIPNIAGLIGAHVHTAFVTTDPQAPSGIKSISNTFSFSITR